ncbi:MAG: 23S rRNA (guanosine(2251)-2'-O)-methyltransferase RlmB [Candidatus Nomurabacteria bacterium]|nr:23S rRNA (guanosine(2251)-2'-O)-methyltransferase RlmB [Candidatus Nomurabacteria bacterium]
MAKEEKIYIYGKHAVMEALANKPESLKKVFLANQDDAELMALVNKSGVSVAKFNGSETGGLDRDAKHQGIIGLLSVDRLVLNYDNFIKNLKITPDTCLVILGELQDPQNVGSIIRTSAAMGIAGIFIPEHNQAPVTGAVVKVSAGMAFRVPLIQIGNINNLIKDLKEKGFWIYGLDGESKQILNDEKFETPTVFIIGNEARGIREKTREHCDVMLRIPMHKQCESMNAAVSTAIALYAWSDRHPDALN